VYDREAIARELIESVDISQVYDRERIAAELLSTIDWVTVSEGIVADAELDEKLAFGLAKWAGKSAT